MGGYWDMGYYRQPTVAEIRSNAEECIRKARKRGEDWEPVVIDGKKIVKNWWGQAWCTNLERYADYWNRLERGRRYVRAGAVTDLKIQGGKVTAKVLGSISRPYNIDISINPLEEKKMQKVIKQCNGKLKHAEDLLSGKFPSDMEEILLEKGMFFPSPEEIKFNCSCPDWADMCKHVAAVLYGVGARLDTDPVLFFKLRGIDIEEFVNATIINRVEKMLANADIKSSRVMDRSMAEGLFGVF